MLDVDKGTKSKNGSHLDQYTYIGNPWQQWIFVTISWNQLNIGWKMALSGVRARQRQLHSQLRVMVARPITGER